MELLVIKGDRNEASKWKDGDIVCVRPDGWGWGKDEADGKMFTIIKLPGVDHTKFKFLEEMELSTTYDIISRGVFRVSNDSIIHIYKPLISATLDSILANPDESVIRQENIKWQR